jgi:hypothetical protein
MSAMFEFGGGGIGTMPDPDDNPDGHVVPHSDAGLLISVEVGNVGDEPGVARVGVEVDDVFVIEWESPQLAPGETTAGRISLGRFGPGTYTILVFVNPGSGQKDHDTSTIDLP